MRGGWRGGVGPSGEGTRGSAGPAGRDSGHRPGLLRAPSGRALGTARCSAGQALAMAVVAALWGGTGPFLRAAAAGMEELRGRGRLRQLLAELRFLSLKCQVRARRSFPGLLPETPVSTFPILGGLSLHNSHLSQVSWPTLPPWAGSATPQCPRGCQGGTLSQLCVPLQYLVPFLLNQAGSLLFYLTLASTGQLLLLFLGWFGGILWVQAAPWE